MLFLRCLLPPSALDVIPKPADVNPFALLRLEDEDDRPWDDDRRRPVDRWTVVGMASVRVGLVLRRRAG